MSGLLCLSLAMLVPGALAHGWLDSPKARQYCLGFIKGMEVGPTAGNGARDLKPPWGGVPGLCGDPFQGGGGKGEPSRFFEMPCEPQETYQAGSTITVTVKINANHGGFFEFRVCDSAELSEDCFAKWPLKRADIDAEQFYMMKSSKGSVGNPSKENSKTNPDVYNVDLQLPPDLQCTHCVMQWTWWTAHHCALPCDQKVCGEYANQQNPIRKPNGSPPYKQCKSKFPAKGEAPQIFRNCADFAITGDGAPGPGAGDAEDGDGGEMGGEMVGSGDDMGGEMGEDMGMGGEMGGGGDGMGGDAGVDGSSDHPMDKHAHGGSHDHGDEFDETGYNGDHAEEEPDSETSGFGAKEDPEFTYYDEKGDKKGGDGGIGKSGGSGGNGGFGGEGGKKDKKQDGGDEEESLEEPGFVMEDEDEQGEEEEEEEEEQGVADGFDEPEEPGEDVDGDDGGDKRRKRMRKAKKMRKARMRRSKSKRRSSVKR